MRAANWKSQERINLDKAEDPVYRQHSFGLNIQSNHIYLMPDIEGSWWTEGVEPGVDWVMSNRFISNAHLCMMSNPSTPLVVHSKTCGGEFGEGMAIFDTLISYPYDTTILNYTHARSMSSIIFQAATKRVMMPHSHFMFHDGMYADEGNMKTVKSGFEFYDKIGEVMLEIYAERMKQRGKFSKWSLDRIRTMLREEMDKKDDVFLTAKETVDWGLADEIFNGNWDSLTEYTDVQRRNGEAYASKLIERASKLVTK